MNSICFVIVYIKIKYTRNRYRKLVQFILKPFNLCIFVFFFLFRSSQNYWLLFFSPRKTHKIKTKTKSEVILESKWSSGSDENVIKIWLLSNIMSCQLLILFTFLKHLSVTRSVGIHCFICDKNRTYFFSLQELICFFFFCCWCWLLIWLMWRQNLELH